MTPYLEGRRVHKTLDHNKKESNNQNLVIRYNVEDASHPTQLYFYMVQQGAPFSIRGVDMFDKVEIDGTEVSVADLDAAEGKYQLSIGEHTVAYTLKDPTFIGMEIDEQTEMPTKVGATFMHCNVITSVIIPNSVTIIGESAFFGCSSLTSVTIPNSVTSIGDTAFRDCTGLTSIIIGDGVTNIGQYAFQNCNKLTSVTIPNSVTSIGWGAFNYCSGLTSVTIGNGVTSIGQEAFVNCSGLTSIDIPDSVTSIGKSAFESCSSLTSVTIGSSVTSIGGYAFCGCPLDSASATAINAINTKATRCKGA